MRKKFLIALCRTMAMNAGPSQCKNGNQPYALFAGKRQRRWKEQTRKWKIVKLKQFSHFKKEKNSDKKVLMQKWYIYILDTICKNACNICFKCRSPILLRRILKRLAPFSEIFCSTQRQSNFCLWGTFSSTDVKRAS